MAGLRCCCVALAVAFSVLIAGASDNNFTFAILGDRTGDAIPGVYEAIWRDTAAFHPDFVINVGDTVQGLNDATAEAEWTSLRPIWQQYHIPFFFTPGNHDIWSPLSRKIYESETKHPPAYSFDFQNAHFIILDNSGGMNLSADQMDFLERDLAANKDRSPKFVFFHQPFWLIPVRFHSGDFPFHQLMRKCGVGYVFSGHGHQFVRLVQDDIVYIEAGSSGAKLKGSGFAKGWFFGEIYARVRGTKVEMTVHEAARPYGEGRKFNAATWTENGATATAK